MIFILYEEYGDKSKNGKNYSQICKLSAKWYLTLWQLKKFYFAVGYKIK